MDNQRYSFSVFLVPKVANRENAADAAVEFVNAKDLSEEELERYKQMNLLATNLVQKKYFTTKL